MKSFTLIISIISFITFQSCDKDPGAEQFIPGSNALSGTKWVITQYSITPAGQLITLNDTLSFESKTAYTYNNQPNTYFLEEYSWGYKLGLKGTSFGYLIGNVPSELPGMNALFGQEFTVYGTETKYYLWLEKV